jgi:cyclopropane-fatty-acyl-phospholipid synthase
MWRFYLAACEQTFSHGRQAVFQLQLSRGIDAASLTRDNLYRESHPVAIDLRHSRAPLS